MSLAVWLPLNGDLHNQGLSNVTVTNNGATVDNNGKIGKCYCPATITLTNLNGLSFNNSSYCFWAKTSSTTGWQLIISIDNTDYSKIHGIYIASSSRLKLEYNPSLNINNADTSNWHHYAFVVQNGINKCYYDGKLKETSTEAVTNDAIGRLRLGVGTAISLNDVRIYDHALSPKEVEEIAKGLVLHYKLDGRFCEATTNLCQQLVAGGQTSVSNNVITHNGTDKDTYWFIKPKEALVGGATYTVSCYLTGFSTNTDWIQWGVGAQSGDNNAGHWKTYNGYNTFTFTMPSGFNGSIANFIFDDSSGGPGRAQVFQISNVQLEKKNHATPFAGYGATRSPTTIYDSSGYSNNGTIVGSLTAAAGSPRYDVATQFPGNALIEAEPLPAETKTISAWIKWNSIPSGTGSSSYTIPLHDKNSGLAIGVYNDGKALISYVGSAAGGAGSNVSCSITTNTWYHIVVVKTGDTTRDVYINNVKQSPITNNYWGGNMAKFHIGGRHLGGSYSAYLNGQIVDVRAYATALSAQQIKELYTTSMQIDSSGNVFARELVEL